MLDELNVRKSCGTDLLYPDAIQDSNMRRKIVEFVYSVLSGEMDKIPDYLRETRLVLLSKDMKEYALVSNTRPISV